MITTHQITKAKVIKALLGQIKTADMLDQTYHQLQLAVSEIYYHPIMFKVLTTSTTHIREKMDLFNVYMRQRDFCLFVQHFLTSLIETQEFGILDDQDKPTFLKLLSDEIKAIRPVSITVATYLSEYLKEWLHTELSTMINYPFVLSISVNTSIVGGMILQTDQFGYEDTIRSSLLSLEEKVYSYVHEAAGKIRTDEDSQATHS